MIMCVIRNFSVSTAAQKAESVNVSTTMAEATASDSSQVQVITGQEPKVGACHISMLVLSGQNIFYIYVVVRIGDPCAEAAQAQDGEASAVAGGSGG